MKIGTVRYVYNPNPNPTLHYKLDPGEPGIASPAPASRSIGKVAAHELTNLRRFKREAMEEGGIVVQSSIHLNLQSKGAFLAATSGKSKARVLIPEKDITPGPELAEITGNQGDISDIAGIDEVEKNKPDLLTDPVLEVKLNNLENEERQQELPAEAVPTLKENIAKEQTTLEEEKGRIKQLLDKTGKADSIGKEEKDDLYLAGKLERVEARLSYLDQLEEADKLQDLFSDLSLGPAAPMPLAGLQNTGAEETAGAAFDVLV